MLSTCSHLRIEIITTSFWLVSSEKINFAPSGPLKARSSICICGGGGVLFERVDPEHGHDKGAGLQGRSSNPRENLAGLSYVVRDAKFGIAPGDGFQTQFLSRRIDGMAQLVHDCGSRASQAV
jgi:hypothetical protein